MTRTPHEILGVEPTATADDIRTAWRRLAVRHHPDAGGDAETFKEIAAAWDALKRRSGKPDAPVVTQEMMDSFCGVSPRAFSWRVLPHRAPADVDTEIKAAVERTRAVLSYLARAERGENAPPPSDGDREVADSDPTEAADRLELVHICYYNPLYPLKTEFAFPFHTGDRRLRETLAFALCCKRMTPIQVAEMLYSANRRELLTALFHSAGVRGVKLTSVECRPLLEERS